MHTIVLALRYVLARVAGLRASCFRFLLLGNQKHHTPYIYADAQIRVYMFGQHHVYPGLPGNIRRALSSASWVAPYKHLGSLTHVLFYCSSLLSQNSSGFQTALLYFIYK